MEIGFCCISVNTLFSEIMELEIKILGNIKKRVRNRQELLTYCTNQCVQNTWYSVTVLLNQALLAPSCDGELSSPTTHHQQLPGKKIPWGDCLFWFGVWHLFGGIILIKLTHAGKPSPVWAVPFPRPGVLTIPG